MCLQCHNTYMEAYQQYRSNSNSRDASRYLAAYHNSHNEYVLQIRASNRQEQHYHQMALPYLLQVCMYTTSRWRYLIYYRYGYTLPADGATLSMHYHQMALPYILQICFYTTNIWCYPNYYRYVSALSPDGVTLYITRPALPLDGAILYITDMCLHYYQIVLP